MSKTEELKLTEEQEAIIDIWDAESDVNTRRIDWVNFAKEILSARPSSPVATVSALKTKDEIRELAKICAPDDGTWFGTAQDSFLNGYFHGRKEALVSTPATRMPSETIDEALAIIQSALMNLSLDEPDVTMAKKNLVKINNLIKSLGGVK